MRINFMHMCALAIINMTLVIAATNHELSHNTTIYEQVKNGSYEGIRTALAHGAQNKPWYVPHSAIVHTAVKHDNRAILELLFDNDFNVNCKKLTSTPLHCAFENGNANSIICLLEYGGDSLQTNFLGELPTCNASFQDTTTRNAMIHLIRNVYHMHHDINDLELPDTSEQTVATYTKIALAHNPSGARSIISEAETLDDTTRLDIVLHGMRQYGKKPEHKDALHEAIQDIIGHMQYDPITQYMTSICRCINHAIESPRVLAYILERYPYHTGYAATRDDNGDTAYHIVAKKPILSAYIPRVGGEVMRNLYLSKYNNDGHTAEDVARMHKNTEACIALSHANDIRKKLEARGISREQFGNIISFLHAEDMH